MAKSTGIEKIKIFPKVVMGQVANRYETIFRKRVQSGIDAKGSKFVDYTPEYAEKKGRGFQKKRGKGRYAGIKVVSSTRIDPPDLTLSGMTLKAFNRLRFGRRYFVMGWQRRSEIVEGQQNQGRDIISDVPKKEKIWLATQINRRFKKYLQRTVKGVTVRVRT
jgi:hypothetical protein